jgi:hypothetical protein
MDMLFIFYDYLFLKKSEFLLLYSKALGIKYKTDKKNFYASGKYKELYFMFATFTLN